MSEQAGADLPEARDGEGQLSKDALRSPAPGAVPGVLSQATSERRSRDNATGDALELYRKSALMRRGCSRGDIATVPSRDSIIG